MRVVNNLLQVVSKEDFGVIASANLLTKTWFERLNQPKGTYISFVGKLSKDPESLLQDVDDETKKQFYAELPQMLVPLVKEPELLQNADRLIYDLINKMKINPEYRDDAYSIGLMAFRNAIWYYNKPEVLFSTFAYIAIRSKLQEFRRILRNKSQEVTFCKLSVAKSKNNDQSFSPEQVASKDGAQTCKSNKMIGSLEKSVSFTYLINQACYDDVDRKIIQTYMQNKKKWVDIFIENNPNPKNGKPYCKWAVRKRFNQIIQRIQDIVATEDIQQYQVLLKG